MKIYAIQEDSEFFDNDIYYNEDDAVCDNIWIGGNRDFISMNDEMFTPILDAMNDVLYELDNIGPEDFENKEDYIAEQNQILRDMFESAEHKLSDEDVDAIHAIISDYETTYHEAENVAKIWSILKHEQFEVITLRGCCQRDWIECIYPASAEDKLNYIEAVYFGTGSEYKIVFDMNDEYADMDKNELIDALADAEDADTYYLLGYNTETLKQEIAEAASSAKHTYTPDDIKLISISNYYSVRTCEYNIE